MPETRSSYSGSGIAVFRPSPTASTHSEETAAAGWYCLLAGQAMGPVSFDDLIEFAKGGQLCADDQVKLGSTGKWRRVGTIGRLASQLPFEEPKSQLSQASSCVSKQEEAVARKRIPGESMPTTSRSLQRGVTNRPIEGNAVVTIAEPERVRINANELELIKAQVAHEATTQAVRQLIAWGFSPNCNPQWWAAIDEIEHGPVDFATIFDWIVLERLKSTDYVRNGVFGTYGPATNLPDVFTAAGIMRKANETFELAKSRAAQLATYNAPEVAAAPVAPIVIAPVRQEPVTSASAVPISAPIPSSVSKQNMSPTVTAITADATPVHSNSTSYSMANSSMPVPGHLSRPASTLPKQSYSSRSSSGSSFFETFFDKLREPGAIGGIGAIVVVMVCAGWVYMSADHRADVNRYKELKSFLAEFRAKRESNATDFTDIQNKAKKLSAEYTAAFKAQSTAGHPAKQHLLWAVRDELPRMMQEDLTVETQEEKNFADRLSNAAHYLKVND